MTPLTQSELDALEKLCESIMQNPIGKAHSGYCGDHETFKLTCQHTDKGGMNEYYADAIIKTWDSLPRLLHTLKQRTEALEKYRFLEFEVKAFIDGYDALEIKAKTLKSNLDILLSPLRNEYALSYLARTPKPSEETRDE